MGWQMDTSHKTLQKRTNSKSSQEDYGEYKNRF